MDILLRSKNYIKCRSIENNKGWANIFLCHGYLKINVLFVSKENILEKIHICYGYHSFWGKANFEDTLEVFKNYGSIIDL